MPALGRFFGSLFGRPHQQTFDTDEVYPLHFLDNLATGRVIVLSETLRFDAVLDATKLHDGLTRLLQQGDWRKLGGRLHMQRNGTLEIHVPRQFTRERPAVRFTNNVLGVAIEDHALGRQFPQPTDGPSLQTGPMSFAPFNAVPSGPATLHDYLCGDEAILGLHVTSFNNATLVALVWPHAVAGALGVKELFAAWSKALRDGADDIPPLLGARRDVLDELKADADQKEASYALGPRQIKGWNFVKFLVRLLWTVFTRPVVESRAVFLPRQFVAQLQQNALQELEAVHDGGNSGNSSSSSSRKGLFLSEGDVLTAWASRFVAAARGGKRPGLIFNPLDIRSRLRIPWQAAGGGGGVYVQNLAGAMYTSVDADMLVKRPLGELAYAVRQSIQQQATDEQIRAQLRLFRALGHAKAEPLYGDANAQLIAFSNWTKFDLFGAVDFSAAVVAATGSAAAGGTPPGRPVYMHCVSLGENRFQRDCFAITGKDLDGNYWITAFLYPEDWQGLEDYIKQTWKRIGT
ncbi:Chloramphenicol acetyltransferase-like domain protein [Niveomyces insectorum RCEF 264]|uniref:Chloramphenicol acetyltransferase-like domain protein n=1 Tax=Niveomyces insectorum RCEF 264 TaxID=1081102 RepID=A0A167SK86_9HYPO|nr:Chloramphenicol acetyltransferase-like domain protein [Niveomyces insectorum RCEF 264]